MNDNITPIRLEVPPSQGAVIGTPNSEEIFAKAKARGEHNVSKIASLTDANELEHASMARFEELVRNGYKFIDLHVRRDGQEYHFEADWLARLFRCNNAL